MSPSLGGRMAERFGGKFSPGAPKTASDLPRAKSMQTRTRVGARVNALFIVPLIFGVTAFWQEPVGMAMQLGALGLLLLAAWMTREGLRAEEAYNARTVAKRPALPRKSIASVLTGAGLLLAGMWSDGLLSGLIYGVLGTVLHGFAFGLDPLRDKGIEGVEDFQTDRVIRAIEGAEGLLKEMTEAATRAGDRDVQRRVQTFADTARAMFRQIESDPRDLTAARKYLTVYLTGARDAAVKFADIFTRRSDPAVKADFLGFLDDLDKTFSERTERLLVDDRVDLDIEMEVLRERLAREGLVPLGVAEGDERA